MRAFTLMEALLYLGLFGALMGSVLPAVGTMRAAAARIETQTLLLSEGAFVLETIAHAEAGGAGTSAFRLSGTTLTENTSAGIVAISGNQVRVSSLSLVQTNATTAEPGYVTISFTLAATTDTGIPLTHMFSERTYID